MKRAFLIAATLLAAATAGTTAVQAKSGWSLIGFKTVGIGTDSDHIDVNSNRVFRQLQLCAFDAPVEMKDFDVFYRNGTMESLSVRSVIAAGTCTRNIDLRGGKRHITRIHLRYERLALGLGKPLIRVMGR